ncbi:MAG: amidohydrolase [Alphaproteobacteria bacterium]|nr:amidohydrolase [Alphaproteobacteria bacterium]
MVLVWSLLGCGTGIEPAERVVRGELWDASGGRPGAVLIAEGRIRDVVDDPTPYIGPDTVVVDAPRITAGFVDAHAHPSGLGRKLVELDLTGLSTLEATLGAVRTASGDGWILGRGWDQNDWSDLEGDWPTAAQLDAVTGERPAALRRVDGHAVWVNAAALAAAGITADTPSPAGGEILKGADGAPLGVLVDTAMDLVPTPEPTAAERLAWAKRGTQAAREAGLTGVHVMGAGDAEITAYQALDARGELPIRLWVYASPGTDAAKTLVETGPFGEGRVRVVGVKAFADGALGSRGAWLSADYADRPGHRGTPIDSQETLTALATDLVAQDAQLAVHAIGDAGVHATLEAFAAARAAHPDKAGVRLRVEHAQVVAPADVPRFAELGAIASMQPTHATSDMPWAEARLGPERVRWAYAWQTLGKAGAHVAFGSDFPVESHEPALGMHAALTRTDADGNPAGGWFPEQRFSDAEAVGAFTAGAAYAAHDETRVGQLAAGRVADLTLWSDDWKPVGTLVDGR